MYESLHTYNSSRQKYNYHPANQKEFKEISLFKRVKLINGDRVYQTLLENTKIQKYRQNQRLFCLQKRCYFAYVYSGQFNAYKRCGREISRKRTPDKNQSECGSYKALDFDIKRQNFRGLLKTVKKAEYWGFQEFVLFCDETLQIETSEQTTLYLTPLELLYQSFRRVIPFQSFQPRLDYLKKMFQFRQTTHFKNSSSLHHSFPRTLKSFNKDNHIFHKIIFYAQRRRAPRNQTLFRQGEQFRNIYIVLEGKCQLTKEKGDTYSQQKTTVCDRNSILGMEELISQSPYYRYTAQCACQTEFLVIPKQIASQIPIVRRNLENSLRKVSNSKFQVELNINNSMNVNEMTQKQGYLEELQIDDQCRSSNKILRSKTQAIAKPFGRPQTTQYDKNSWEDSIKGQDQRKTRPFFKTETSGFSFYAKSNIKQKDRYSNDTNLNNYGKSQTGNQKNSDLVRQATHVSMGQLHMMKFIQRKEKIQNRQIVQYVKSRAPQLIMNPSKQFSLLKPLHTKQSNYIRNYKRKLKSSLKRSNHTPYLETLQIDLQNYH